MVPRVLVMCAVIWYLGAPAWSCLINNCPQGGKRSGLRGYMHKLQSPWHTRQGTTQCSLKGAHSVCVGPLCCDPLGPVGAACVLDYETCGSGRDLMEKYTLCGLPGLSCNLDNRKCCNLYDDVCFDSITCMDKEASDDHLKIRDQTQQLDLSAYNMISQK